MPGDLPTAGFTEDSIPQWCCPECLNASLEVVKDSFHYHRSAYSIRNRKQDWYDVDHETFVFHCMLQCSRRICQESVAVSGTGSVESEPDDQQERWIYYVVFRARSFVPPLPVFSVPEDCPDNIKRQLKNIAALLPLSGSATVNAIRVVLEMILDEYENPEGAENSEREPKYVPLTQRIENNKVKLGNHYQAFSALKDVGNYGSHTEYPMSESDVEGACRVLDGLITSLYGKPADYTRIVSGLAKRYGKDPK